MILYYQKLRKELLALLEDLENQLPQNVVKDFQEYIEYNEFGVAFEGICEQLFEYKIKISREIYEKIDLIGTSMKMDEKAWSSIKSLVKND